MLDLLPDWKSLSAAEKVDMVTPLVASGLSSAQIAAGFRNVSRSSIIGLCHRKGLKLGENRPKPPQQERSPKPHGNKGQPKANAIVARARRRPPTPPAEIFDMEDGEGVDVTHLVGILDLERSSCRWPMRGEGSATLFCGQHSYSGSYCPAHAARAEVKL